MTHEFSLIRKIRQRLEMINRQHPALKVPPGDDAALMASLARPVISTDCQREGVHFRLDWQTPFDIGQKAVSVTLSDLAASYASPVCLFVNLSLPDHFSEDNVLQLYDGICEALTVYACALGGGNISTGPVLALDLFAVGEGTSDLFPLRSKAKVGEGLYATGPLGLARAGLDSLERGCTGIPEVLQAFKAPRARFDASTVLAGHGIACVMDISDGLAGDALHLAEASDISIRFDIDSSHIPPVLAAYCDRFSLNALDMMLAGGEDYELLFSCEPDVFDTLSPLLPGAFRVGDCLPYDGVRLINPPQSARSFIHQTRD
jgi:thiamine-monophosphate kinase